MTGCVYTVKSPDGLPFVISWVAQADWDRHWAVSRVGVEVARYGAYTEARRAVLRGRVAA